MKSFELEYKGKTYVFTMTRRALMAIEKEGFNPNDAALTLTNIYSLFYAALLKNHPNMTRAKATEMLDDLTTANENGEVLYSFKDIGECLGEITQPCYEDLSTTAPKNVIKK